MRVATNFSANMEFAISDKRFYKYELRFAITHCLLLV